MYLGAPESQNKELDLKRMKRHTLCVTEGMVPLDKR